MVPQGQAYISNKEIKRSKYRLPLGEISSLLDLLPLRNLRMLRLSPKDYFDSLSFFLPKREELTSSLSV